MAGEGRKKPGMAFWATVVVVVVPLFYFASLGPMVMANRPMLSRWPEQWFHIYAVYMAPANYVRDRLPDPARHALDDYLRWFAPPRR